MKKQIIYQGKGISKRYTLSMIFFIYCIGSVRCVFFNSEKVFTCIGKRK